MTALEWQSPTAVLLHNPASALLTFVLVYIITQVASRLYSTFIGPLSKFPGPKIRAFSVLPWVRTNWNGEDNAEIPKLHRQYGDVVRISPDTLSFIGNEHTWKDIYGFRKHGQAEATKDKLFYGSNINGVPGLITADYHTHSRQRKIVSHAFSDKALKEQEPMLKHWAEKLKNKLSEQSQNGQKVDMLKMLNCTTFDIMGDLTFAEPWVKTIFAGIKYGTRIRAVKLLSQITHFLINKILSNVPSVRVKQMQHWRYTTDRVDRRLAKTPDRPDLFTRILEKSQGPDGLSLQEYYSISSLFMVAGTETTATALSGTIYHLLRNHQYLDSLQQELRDNFMSMDELSLESLARLPMLEAAIKEGIRMYPPVPIGLPRVAPAGGMLINDHLVPEGTLVLVHQLATYRNESNFKYADKFRPERWLGKPEFADDCSAAFEPFSVGPRNCLGKNLAWHEMRLLLSTVLLHFDFELCQESSSWAKQKVYTLWEKPALMCKLSAV